MNKKIIFIVTLIFLVFSNAGSSQITAPKMMLHSLENLESRNMEDGRVTRRISGDAIGLIRVEWPAGTITTPHNHANELIVLLIEGRLRALGGETEFILMPGDLVVVPAYVEHGYEALEDSITIEAVGPG
ncbi:MAG: cupin domain-containing protein [Gammaproteobacteria bacterium]|nr:cupin domain-containing protein [Gammaproteobacteria bacterium]